MHHTPPTQQASDGIIWDCPVCDSDEGQFHRTGKLAGTAICRECGHKWNWKQSRNIDTENPSTRGTARNRITARAAQDQTALKDIGGANSRVNESRTTAADSLSQTRQKVERFRLQALSKAASLPKPETSPDELYGAWPKPALKKTATKTKSKASRPADSGSSESEFEGSDYESNASKDDDDDDFADPQKPKKNKGKQSAASKPSPAPKRARSPAGQDHDDDDNDSIFSDTGNDVYVSEEDELDDELDDEELLIQAKEITSLKQTSKNNNSYAKPNTKNRYSMWIMFNKANRKRIADENPGCTNVELSRLVSEAYRQMPLEDREALRKDASEHRKELDAQKQPKTTAPRNGYILLSMEMSAKFQKENPDYSIQDRNSVASRMWRELPDEEKKAYSARAKQMRDDFAKRHPEQSMAMKQRAAAKRSESMMRRYAAKKRKMDLEDE